MENEQREPLALTLEEAIAALTDKEMWLEAHPLLGGRTEWTVWALPDPDSIYVPVSGANCLCEAYSWPEAAAAALGRPVVARDSAAELKAENERLRAALTALVEEASEMLHEINSWVNHDGREPWTEAEDAPALLAAREALRGEVES